MAKQKSKCLNCMKRPTAEGNEVLCEVCEKAEIKPGPARPISNMVKIYDKI